MAQQKKTTIPDKAKQPTDRKPKAAEVPDDVTVTVNGVEVHLSADVLDDFELLDDLAELDKGNGVVLPRVLRSLAGDAYQELLDTVRDSKRGKVSIEAGGELIQKLMDALDPN